jgi:hypothetical protein
MDRMRSLAGFAASLLLPVAALAATEMPRNVGSPAECARLHKQIAHFEAMVERAEAQESEMWAEYTQRHVDLLRDRQRERCPDDAEDASAKAAFLAFLNLLKVAGRAALTYFTFGAF